MFRKSRSAQTTVSDALRQRAATWEKLAASARERDEGPQAHLRECRPYPKGYWQGVRQGLETAARELRELADQIDAR